MGEQVRARLAALLVLDRWSIAAYLVSVAIGLVGLSLAGRAAADVNQFEHFVRFHRYINPETFFYPTASQVRALAKASVRRDQVAVIIGGSSVLNGVGQSPEDLWSRALQEQLGESYVVLNFALPAGAPEEHGAVAAQALIKEGYKVVYIADTPPAFFGNPDGLVNRYVFWDAYYKGYLLESAAGTAKIESVYAAPAEAEKLQELRMRSVLDSYLYFTDLWTALGYHKFFTVWNLFMSPPAGVFVMPHKLFKDPATGVTAPPLAQRYPEAATPTEMHIVRAISAVMCTDSQFESVSEQARTALPDELRRRTIVSVTRNSRFFVDRLDAQERACYERTSDQMVAALQQAGYRARATGADFTAEDYNDRVHLVASGGVKLAAELAPLVRELSQDLGYLQP